MDAVLKRVEADLKAQKVAAKDIKLYIKPQDGACYYVADGKVAGRVDLFYLLCHMTDRFCFEFPVKIYFEKILEM